MYYNENFVMDVSLNDFDFLKTDLLTKHLLMMSHDSVCKTIQKSNPVSTILFIERNVSPGRRRNFFAMNGRIIDSDKNSGGKIAN